MPSGTSAGGGAALSAPVSVVGKRTGLLLPPSPPTSRPKPQDCESGIGSRTSTLRSVASSSAAAASSPPRTSHLKGPVTVGAVLLKATGGSAHLIAGPGVGRVLGSSGSSGGGGAVACPSCGMPFDKAKKRRLIDACGHERCYSCMFANEACPLCAASTMMASGGKDGGGGRPSPLGAPPGGNIDIVVLPKAKKVSGNSLSASNASIRASETALYGGREGSRPKMKTNGHFTSYMKSRHHQQQPNDAANGESSQWSSSSSWRPPKAHPSINRPPHSSSSSSYSSSSAATHSTAICRHISPDTAAAIRMTQSCPTPPQTRRRFFLSAKSLKNPWRQHHQETAPGAVDPGGGNVEAQVEAKASSPLNALMTASAIAESVTSSLATSLTSSWSSTGTWAEGAIRRIKALWWGGPPTAHNGGPRGSRGGGTVGLNILAREEGPQCRDGGEVEEASSSARQGGGPCRTRGASRTSQSDLHVRLGLLLGDEGSGWSPDTDCQSRVMGGSGYADRETRSPDAGSSSGCRSSLSPPRSCAPLSGGVVPHHRRGPSGCSSLLLSSASLVSLDAPRPPHGGADGGASGSRVIGTSNNTSPASTLTGSSEADVQCRVGRYVVGNRVMPRGLAAAARDRSSDSLASLASLCSSTSPANTTQQQIRRRHSVTTLQPGHVEDLDSFGMRRASIRRSARGGTVADGPTDPKIRFAQFLRRQQQQHDAQCHIPPCQQQQLTLRPLFFEVPLPEWDAPRPLFVGRAWLLESIAVHLKLPPLIPSMYSSQTAGTSINEGTVPLTGTARRSKRQVQSQQTTSASSSGQEIKSSTQCNQNVGNGRGVAIVGGPGTGKTALLLQLVESSCFGRHREPPCRDLHRCGGSGHPGAEEKCCINLVSEKVQALASHVVAYHFCQAENNSTCLVPDFVHSVAAQLCQAPQLVAYRDLLLSNPDLQALLSLPHCIADPDEAIVKGILEPLESIGTPKCDADSLAGSFHQNLSDSYHGESEAMQSSLHGKMQSSYHSSMQGSGQGSQFGDGFCKDMMSSSVGEDSVDRKASCIILVDGLCEAEYHRPDRGPSLGTFLAMHSKRFPPWLKLIVTARTRFADTVLAKDLPYTRISLDDISTDDNLQRDLVDYIHFRASHSPTIRANLSLASPSNTLPSQQQTSPTTSISGMPSAAMAPHGEAAAITRFSQHLLRLSGGSFLFTKLTLDLIERGQLVTKSSSYKVLPLTLAQIFLLHFNLRFHTVRAFERVLPILSVVLASLSPPTLLEVFYSVNALRVERFLSWDEFITRFKTLSGFIVKRLDDTYMFFHPAFREWLIRREEGDSTKFLCDPRIGHLGVALRLTRLQCPLEGEALLELGHHILKAHPHRGLTLRWPLCSRDLQATWVAGAAADASRSLATLRNSYAPNVKVSRLLLLAGASPNARLDATPGDPLLSVAAQRGDTEVVSLLLEFGADAGAESSVGCTALSLAASAGHEGVVAALLNARGPAAGAGRMDREGRCPLVLASLGGHMGVVALLLSSDWVVSGSGREVSLEEASVQSLVAAAMQGHTELVEYLLDMCNVSPDVVDRLTGETALTASVSYGRHSTAAALLMRGASVTVPNSKGLPPLVAAVSGGGCATVRRQGTVCSVVELLLQVGGASPEQRDSSGRTALAHAAADGNVTLVRLLLEKGTSVHLEDKEGLSALGWACLKGQVATARVLLDAGAQVQRADASGRTPLHLAAAAPSASQQSSTPLVQLLLERGAVLEGVDAMGLRPLDRAVGTRNISGVHCFLRRGARLGPATWAMAAGKPDVTLILLNKLLEDGNVLYKKGRLQEASHRYRYALKKCPSEEETVACAGVEGGWAMDDEEDSPAKLRELFDSVRVHLMLNLSRCTRKLGEYSEAVELAEGVLRLRPDSYEAHYARAKAKVDLGDVDGALQDIEEALRVVPSGNREARRVLRRVQEELQAEVCPKVSTAKREPCLGEDERVTEE